MVELGHYVLYVRNAEPMAEFYSTILGLEKVGDTFGGRAVALTGGRTHHELLLIEVGNAPGPLRGQRLGLYHTGWCIGDHDDQLREALARCQQHGVKIQGLTDHGVSHSLYIDDPEGNELELYVDVPEFDWKNRDDWLEHPVRPLHL
ncbi:MAG: VOC family protein [Candidatus Poseidoniales archaeon]